MPRPSVGAVGEPLLDRCVRAVEDLTEVRQLLEADAELSEWGIDTRLIGSYARQTAQYPGKDVDPLLRFTALSVWHRPEKLYDAVERVLVEAYGVKGEDQGGRITRQSRSLKIEFQEPEDHFSQDAFAIDAVPAVPWQEH